MATEQHAPEELVERVPVRRLAVGKPLERVREMVQDAAKVSEQMEKLRAR